MQPSLQHRWLLPHTLCQILDLSLEWLHCIINLKDNACGVCMANYAATLPNVVLRQCQIGLNSFMAIRLQLFAYYQRGSSSCFLSEGRVAWHLTDYLN